jgi:hypothetical protein
MKRIKLLKQKGTDNTIEIAFDDGLPEPKISSHNTMSYEKPYYWWMVPYNWIAKCQSKNIVEQYMDDVRCFDLRIHFDREDGTPHFQHGLMRYKGDVYEVLKYLNKNTNVKVRLVLECLSPSKAAYQIPLFRDFCIKVKEKYNYIHFFEFAVKYNWSHVLEEPIPTYDQYVSSMKGKGLCRIWPWLYSKLNNKKVYKKLEAGEFKEFDQIFIDFI